MKVLFVGSECYPFAKTGGLGDVMSALPKALAAEGVDVRVMMPKYACIPDQFKERMEYVCHFDMDITSANIMKYVGVMKLEQDGVIYYFIDNEEYFSNGNPYTSMAEDLGKFIFFDKAVLAALPVIGFEPDVIHCHDWQAGLVPVYLHTLFRDSWVGQNSKTIITVHNLKFQGQHELGLIKYLSGLPDYVFTPDQLEINDDANMLKGALVYSDIISTVSNTYAGEIKTAEYGEYLDPVIRYHHMKLCGIVNGIDYDIWNPATDEKIAQKFDVNSVIEGKKANKRALQEELGLEVDDSKFMIALISRLTDQKGLDLIAPIFEQFIDGNTQFVLIGTGEPQYEDMFRYFENEHKGTVSSNIMYSDERAHKVYAAADAFLVPSRFEPCGLTQLISFRYGSIPIVRETGGLKDTVQAYNWTDGSGNGFSFDQYRADLLLNAVNYAKTLYFTERDNWDAMVRRAMETDHSWNASRHHPMPEVFCSGFAIYFFFFAAFSALRLSLMILTCSSVISVTLFSFAQSTQPMRTVFRKGRGTLTKFMRASSVNLMSGSQRLAAYLMESMSISFGAGTGSLMAFLPLNGVYQKLVESR